jgi:hypothetical protein
MKKTNKKIWCALALSALLAGAIAWFTFGDSVQESLNRRDFDPIEWQDQRSITNGVRILMVDDLLRRHSFKGMAREQVTAIIGQPTKTEYFKDWGMVYWLGPERGYISIDSEWLVFRLDNQNKVTKVRVARD